MLVWALHCALATYCIVGKASRILNLGSFTLRPLNPSESSRHRLYRMLMGPTGSREALTKTEISTPNGNRNHGWSASGLNTMYQRRIVVWLPLCKMRGWLWLESGCVWSIDYVKTKVIKFGNLRGKRWYYDYINVCWNDCEKKQFGSSSLLS